MWMGAGTGTSCTDDPAGGMTWGPGARHSKLPRLLQHHHSLLFPQHLNLTPTSLLGRRLLRMRAQRVPTSPQEKPAVASGAGVR